MTSAVHLAAIAERYRPALWRYVRVLGADDALADDLVQEAFLVVLRRADFDAGDPVAVFAFLRRTARHLWLKSRRSRTDERAVAEADAIWDERCGEGDGGHYVDALRRCVESLTRRNRELLEATYGEDRGRAESGRRFGMTNNGVKSALRRLRAFLHGCIAQRLEIR